MIQNTVTVIYSRPRLPVDKVCCALASYSNVEVTAEDGDDNVSKTMT